MLSSPRGAPRDARVAGTPLRGPITTASGIWVPAFAGTTASTVGTSIKRMTPAPRAAAPPRRAPSRLRDVRAPCARGSRAARSTARAEGKRRQQALVARSCQRAGDALGRVVAAGGRQLEAPLDLAGILRPPQQFILETRIGDREHGRDHV